MQDFFFAIGHFCQKTFDWFLVSLGWITPVVFAIVLAIGAADCMMSQARYTRKAIERNERI